MDVHLTLYPFYTTKKITNVTATVPKHVPRWQQCFFSHRIKLRGLLLSAVIVSLHHHGCLRSAVLRGETPIALK